MKQFLALFVLLPTLLRSLIGINMLAQAQDDCAFELLTQETYKYKTTYTVGVHAVRGLETTLQENAKVFSEYLTATAGKKFDPPIEFNVVAYFFGDLMDAIQNGEVDFIYANPGVFTCVGVQFGATPLTTVVKSLNVRHRTFELDVYGGVIAVRTDNDQINTIADLKDKIIGAGAIVDFMGGQMQIYEMERAGLSYVNDPKQVVFTKNQDDVVHGVLDGTYDAGFVRTSQIEMTTDKNGDLIDPDMFKIIDPKIYVMETGALFPFLHSTEITPEWPFAALQSVPENVQRVVQSALLDFGQYALMGNLQECASGSLGSNESDWCKNLASQSASLHVPCNATDAIIDMAANASRISTISDFRPARSYFEIRAILEDAGFILKDGDGFRCTRPDNLYDGITCPKGHFKRNVAEFNNGCNHVGLPCDENPEYDCFCRPCVKAFEVDVYPFDASKDEDSHLIDNFDDSLPGCEKMEICGTFKQRGSISMRIFDNMLRDGAEVSILVHAGEERKEMVPTQLKGTYAYDFVLTDNEVGAQVIEVFVNGEPISQSPIRVMVEEADCTSQYGEGSNRVPDAEGVCVCSGSSHEIGGTCVGNAGFFLMIFSVVFLFCGILLSFYLAYKKKQSDSVWHINVDELHFNEPPEVIGAGGFGIVILGQYRGTKVAVKRVLPPSKYSKRDSGSLTTSERNHATESGEISADKVHSNSMEMKKTNKDAATKGRVKFGAVNHDIESQQTVSKSGSMQLRGSISGSNKDWERMMMGNTSSNDVLKLLESATSSDHGSGGMFDGSVSKSAVILRYLPMWMRYDAHSRRVTEFVNEMRMLSRLRHPCITTVMGAVVSSAVDPMLVMEYMEYGSLYDLLHNETMTPGGEIILQVVRDIVQGIQFLHASKPPILHGDLKAKNILVDSRFRAKVADFGFSHFKCTKQRNILQGTPFYMAPEYLRRRSEYTTACDIYSLAMIIYEIYARSGPFEGEDPRKMLPKICHPRLNKRPTIPESCPPKMVDLMKKCWSANAFFRPSAKDIDYVLVEMNAMDTEPLATAQERVRDTLKRKPTSLYDVFPKHIADALNAGKKVEAESHEIVTVVFSDIVGFTTISQQFGPMKVSNMLDRLYQEFDKLAAQHHIFKVETIGDAYMGVTNLDGSEYDTHVKQVAEYAQDAVRAASQILIDEEDPSMGYVQIRVGFHSGPVVSNVIGSLNPRYGLFGDTVNTASRMESNSMPGKIQCTFTSAQLLQSQAPDIPLVLRGMIKVKGKGKMKTFWVGGEDLLNTPVPTLSIPEPMDPVTERSEDDLIHGESQLDLSDHGTQISQLTHDAKPFSSGKDYASHLSHDTEKCDSLSDAGRDHFISVHTQHESNPTKIGMDGSIEQV